MHDITILPGALALLNALPADRVAIVTSATRALATARIAAAGLPAPAAVVTFDDVDQGKARPGAVPHRRGQVGYRPVAVSCRRRRAGRDSGRAAAAAAPPWPSPPPAPAISCTPIWSSTVSPRCPSSPGRMDSRCWSADTAPADVGPPSDSTSATAARQLSPARNSPSACSPPVIVDSRPGERHPQRPVAVDLIEIDTRGHGHAGLVEQSRAEQLRIVGQVRDVGVHVERAVRRGQPVDAEFAQPVQQQSVRLIRISGHVPVALVVGVERAHRRVLREGGRADRHVAGQGVDRVGQVVGHQHPADPPAGHREVLGERIDDEPRPVGRPGAGRPRRNS